MLPRIVHKIFIPLATILLCSTIILSSNAQTGTVIRVGSKAFTENRILNWLVYHALSNNGFLVFFQTDDATTFELRELLVSGEIDIYVEYTGTGVLHLTNQFPDNPSLDYNAGYNATESYIMISSFDAVNNDLIWLNPAPANNTYALAVRSDFASENGLATVQDFAAYVNANNPVRIAAGKEFCDRPDGLPAFESTYDFIIQDNEKQCLENGTPQDTVPKLQQQTTLNGAAINVAMTYGTASENLIYDVVVLEDNLGSQFVYNPTPVIRGEIARQYPNIAQILNPIFTTLTNRELQDLNLQVAEFQRTPSRAALLWLIDKGFVVMDEPPGTDTITCEIERDGTGRANIRKQPNLTSEVIAALSPGLQLPVSAQTTDSDGFIWWRVDLRDPGWIREDVVIELGQCNLVPIEN